MSSPNAFVLCSGSRAFVAALRDDLDACRTTLCAQFMTFEGDDSGEEFAQLLIDKASEGVEVRLLLDHYTDVIADDIVPIRLGHRATLRAERQRTRMLLERLTRAGVAVHRTAPSGRLYRYLLYRNHKKMVLIDGGVGFIGGINVSDHNYAWHDFMTRVSGPIVADIQRDFDSTWNGTTIPLDPPQATVDFVLNQSPGRAAILDEILRMIDGARRTIAIESPSLLGGNIERHLRAAAHRGVRITIVAPARHNRWIFRVWNRSVVVALDHPNVTIYRYSDAHEMTHAKALVVDGTRATFGSFNLFELESLAQKELNIFTSDPSIVRSLEAMIDADARVSSISPTPHRSFGRCTYDVLYRYVAWWTRRLLDDPKWKAIYC